MIGAYPPSSACNPVSTSDLGWQALFRIIFNAPHLVVDKGICPPYLGGSLPHTNQPPSGVHPMTTIHTSHRMGGTYGNACEACGCGNQTLTAEAACVPSAEGAKFAWAGTKETICENEGTVTREGIYTKLVHVSCRNGAEFVALIKPDQDRDEYFKCFDIDNNEWLRVRGWLAEVTDYNED